MHFQAATKTQCLSVAIVLAALCTASVLSGQREKKPPAAKPGEELATKADGGRVTPRQKLGLRLLSIAQSEARGVPSDMRAFLLWQASRGYARINHAKAESLLQDAFRATLSIPKDQDRCAHSEAELCGTRYWLQKQVLQNLISQSKRMDDVEPLLASAESESRQMVEPSLFRRFIREKAFDRARDLLTRMSDENGHFPYHNAAELMEALPRARSMDRLGVFFAALAAYQQHADEKYPSSDDLALVLLRFWQDLPSSVALDTVDQILSRAKDADKEQHDNVVGISTSQGDVYLSSVYQFRLYQLMPVLSQLDPPRAEDLLSQNNELQAAVERYPQSLASMNAWPDAKTSAGTSHLPGILSIGAVDPAQAAADKIRYEIVRRQDKVLNDAKEDPGQALLEALDLPLASASELEDSPRASALISLAGITASGNPLVAKAALAETRKLTVDMPPRDQARILEELPELYLRLGNQDEARNTLNELLKIAAKLYTQDSDHDDPNQAFKAMWPSTNLWQHCIALATKLAPTLAEEMIEEIPDPEIKAMVRVTFANSLLGANATSLSVIEKHKGRISASIGGGG